MNKKSLVPIIATVLGISVDPGSVFSNLAQKAAPPVKGVCEFIVKYTPKVDTSSADNVVRTSYPDLTEKECDSIALRYVGSIVRDNQLFRELESFNREFTPTSTNGNPSQTVKKTLYPLLEQTAPKPTTIPTRIPNTSGSIISPIFSNKI